MFETNVGGSATRTDDTETNRLSSVALETDLEPRVVRLAQLVAGFGDVLERFKGASAAFGATVFDNFDDPGVSNDALDLLFASSTDARRDLAVLRRDAPKLVAAPDAGAGHPLVRRLALLGASAAAVAAGFEAFERSIGPAVPPRTPGGVGRLNEFVALIVRALLDIAEAIDGLRWDPVHPVLAAEAGTQPVESPTRPPEQRRSSAAAIGMPVAGALWQILRRRRTRLMIEGAGVVVVGLVILASALSGGGHTPGSITDPGSASVRPSGTDYPGVAVGSSPPSLSPAPDASTVPGQSGAAPTSGVASTSGPSSAAPTPTPPRPTPRPAHTPAPTVEPAARATQFGNLMLTAAGSIDGFLDTIGSAVQDADLPTVTAAADDIATTATMERSWLLSHPAAACYESFQEAAFTAYGELIVTASAIVDDVNAGDANAIHPEVASSHGDVSMLRQAGNKAVAACA